MLVFLVSSSFRNILIQTLFFLLVLLKFCFLFRSCTNGGFLETVGTEWTLLWIGGRQLLTIDKTFLKDAVIRILFAFQYFDSTVGISVKLNWNCEKLFCHNNFCEPIIYFAQNITSESILSHFRLQHVSLDFARSWIVGSVSISHVGRYPITK